MFSNLRASVIRITRLSALRQAVVLSLTFLVLLFLAGGLVAWGTGQYSAEGPLDEAICLQVRPGSNMRIVSEDLAEQGAVTNAAIYRIGTDYAGLNPQLKAGSFLVPAGSSMEEIADIVTRGGASTCGSKIVYRVGVTRTLAEVRELDVSTGRFVEIAQFNPTEDPVPEAYEARRAENDTQYEVIIAEGVTSWQVVQALNALDFMDGEVTEIPPEGMLAPNSYEVQPGDSVAEVLVDMQDAQAEILAEAWAQRAEGLPPESPEEARRIRTSSNVGLADTVPHL